MITLVTLAIRRAWVRIHSALSAKNSMNTKITPEMPNRTIHSGVGMIPSAPWTRSWRACSRSDVWSIQRSYADCSASVCGSVAWRVRNISRPHGLMASPRVPASMAGHSRSDDVAGVADQLAGQRGPVGVAGRNCAVSTCWTTVIASASAPERDSS